jgi:uncharacterized membrane protein
VDLLYYLLSGICAQRPDHTIAVGGHLLPLEARMGGIFAGFCIGLLYAVLLGRARSWLLPGGVVALLLLAGVAVMGLDGLNAYLFDIHRPHLYTPSLAVRLATGLLAGFGLAAFAIPVMAAAIWKEGDEAAPVEGVADLAVGYAVLALGGLVTLADIAPLFVPLALLQFGSVLASFTAVNAYLLVLLAGRLRRARTWSQLAPLGGAGGALTFAELLAFAALRAYAEHSLGVRWVA